MKQQENHNFRRIDIKDFNKEMKRKDIAPDFLGLVASGQVKLAFD
ncbi:MAG: hypothetical protein ACXIUD_17510 [Mongoliitalea sp.]